MINIIPIPNNTPYALAHEMGRIAAKRGNIAIPQHYVNDIFDYQSEYQIWYGGRGSAKTWVKAIQFLIKCKDAKYFRGFFTRQSKVEARESSYQLFDDLINKIFPFLADEFICQKSTMRIIHRQTGNFIKGGSFENPPRSLAEYTDFWVDEPITHNKSIKRADLIDISGTLRNSYGVALQKHLTFNPISIKSFIYKDFFENNIYKSSKLLCNYQHNPFLSPDKIAEYESYKFTDPRRYRVDTLGEWGTPAVDEPFLVAFDYNKHVSRTHYRPMHPVDIGIDFGQLNAFIIRQSYTVGENLHYKAFNDTARGGVQILEAKRGYLKEMVYYCVRKYGQSSTLRITGDCAGESIGTSGIADFMLLEQHLRTAYWDIYQSAGDWEIHRNKYKILTMASGRYCNELIRYFGDNYIIDEINALALAEDCMQVQATENGSLDKVKAIRAGIGHCLDGERYALQKFQRREALTVGVFNLVENV